MKRLSKQELEDFANGIKEIFKVTSTLQPHEKIAACKTALWELETLKMKKITSRKFRRGLRIKSAMTARNDD